MYSQFMMHDQKNICTILSLCALRY